MKNPKAKTRNNDSMEIQTQRPTCQTALRYDSPLDMDRGPHLPSLRAASQLDHHRANNDYGMLDNIRSPSTATFTQPSENFT